MPTSELSRRLPSSFVDKTLVQNLEDCLSERIRQRPGHPDTTDEEDWKSVEITHRAGRRSLGSISELAGATFPDGTDEIAIVWRTHRPDVFEVRVQFSVHRRDSFVRVRYADDEARALAIDLVTEVARIVARKRTWNSWFCPDIGLSGLVDGLAAGVIVLIVYALVGRSMVPRWIIVTSALLPAYRLVGFFKPYSEFETPQTPTIRTVGNWLSAGLAGFALLTALGAYFDIDWLGF